MWARGERLRPWDGSSLQGPAELKSCRALPIQPQYDGSHAFLLFDDESSGEEEGGAHGGG